MSTQSQQTVLEHVIQVVAEYFPADRSLVTPDADIVFDFDSDSMTSVEIPMMLEADYDLAHGAISVDDFYRNSRVSALAEFVQRKLDEKAGKRA